MARLPRLMGRGRALEVLLGADDIPGVDQIMHSWNVRDIANVPKQGPFADLSSLNSDLAFSGTTVVQGNFSGFIVWDVANPKAPVMKKAVVCPTDQGDPSIYGKLLFISVETTRGTNDCGLLTAEDSRSWRIGDDCPR